MFPSWWRPPIPQPGGRVIDLVRDPPFQQTRSGLRMIDSLERCLAAAKAGAVDCFIMVSVAQRDGALMTAFDAEDGSRRFELLGGIGYAQSRILELIHRHDRLQSEGDRPTPGGAA